jgi:hypothetical protein
VCSRGARANALCSGIREEGRLSPMVFSVPITLGIPFRDIGVLETDRVDSHRTPGYLYDKLKPMGLIAKVTMVFVLCAGVL